jgi:hypothetical protein
VKDGSEGRKDGSEGRGCKGNKGKGLRRAGRKEIEGGRKKLRKEGSEENEEGRE